MSEETDTKEEHVEIVEETEQSEDKKEEVTINMSSSALKERLARERKKAISQLLKDAGVDSIDSIKALSDELSKLKNKEEEAKREELSEIERYKSDLEAALRAKEEAEKLITSTQEQVEAAKVEAHLHSLFAKKGITNTEYALFKIEQKLNTLGDDEELDEVEFLDELLSSDQEKYSLGVSSEPPKPETRAVTTTHTKKGPDPKPEDNKDEFDAMKASNEDFKKRLMQLGFHG